MIASSAMLITGERGISAPLCKKNVLLHTTNLLIVLLQKTKNHPPRGFVAQIELRSGFPLPQTDLP